MILLARVRRPQIRRKEKTTPLFSDGVFCNLFWILPDFVTPHIRYAETFAFFPRPNLSCEVAQSTTLRQHCTMDTAIQPRQKLPSKQSAATARYERLKQKEKEKRIATVGANHLALAAPRVRGPKNLEMIRAARAHGAHHRWWRWGVYNYKLWRCCHRRGVMTRYQY